MNDNNDIVTEALFNQADRFKKRVERFLKRAVTDKKFYNAFSGKFCKDDNMFSFKKFEKNISEPDVEFKEFDDDLDVFHMDKLDGTDIRVTFDVDLKEPANVFQFLTGIKAADATQMTDKKDWSNGVAGLKGDGESLADSFSNAHTKLDFSGDLEQLFESIKNDKITINMKVTVRITAFSYKEPEKPKLTVNAVGNLDKSIFELISKFSGNVYLTFTINAREGGGVKLKAKKFGTITIRPARSAVGDVLKKNLGFLGGALLAAKGDAVDSVNFNSSFSREDELGEVSSGEGRSGSSSEGHQDAIREFWNNNIDDKFKKMFDLDVTYKSKSGLYILDIYLKETDKSTEGAKVLTISFKEK